MEKKVSLSRHFCVSDSAYNSLSHMVCSNFDFRFFLTSHMCFGCLLLFLFLVRATTTVQFIRQHHNLRSLSMWFSSRWLYDTTSWEPITFWKSINYFNHSTRTRSFLYRCRASCWLCVSGCARGAFLYDSHRNVVLNFCQIAASLDHGIHTPDDSAERVREARGNQSWNNIWLWCDIKTYSGRSTFNKRVKSLKA